MQNLEPWVRNRCPFCLHDGPRYKFEHVLKNGKVASKLICPDCKKVFYRASDVNTKTVAQYAQWIVDYPSGAFWAKVNFDLLKLRMRDLGVVDTFWDAYKAAKAVSAEKYQTERAEA